MTPIAMMRECGDNRATFAAGSLAFHSRADGVVGVPVGIRDRRAGFVGHAGIGALGWFGAMGIGEALVAPAGAGELGVEVDRMADVANDEEGRASVAGRDVGDVIAGLVVGAFEGAVKGGGAAAAVAGFGGGRPVIAPTLERPVIALTLQRPVIAATFLTPFRVSFFPLR